MRALAVTATLVAASACCLDVEPDDACVVTRAPQPSYCFPLHQVDLHCWTDAEDPPPMWDSRDCPGTVYRDQDCDARGFTVLCWEDTYVRPGDQCAP